MEFARLQRHKQMYKGKSALWKDVLRENCYQRLKSSRSRLLDKFRGGNELTNESISALIEEEWTKLCSEQRNLPGLFKDKISSFLDVDDSETNYVISLFEEIQKELLEEEKVTLAESYASYEISALESTVHWLNDEEVICPMCKRFPVMQSYSAIICKCGMKLDNSQTDLTLAHFKSKLDWGLQAHSEVCGCAPSFSLVSLTDETNLTITCDVCYFMFLVN